ncbi:MAG: hypothetical protein IJO88_00295 [Oscillospiraceae bacterium]|nr:hypothetical protein [Oscillospiraceae bacterium]
MAILDDLDNIKEKATEVAAAAAKKTKQLARISKANIEIYALEDKIKKAQLELGRLYYRDHAAEEERDIAEYLPYCKKIDAAKREIAELRDYIEDLKNGTEDDEIILQTDLPAVVEDK